MADPMQHNDGVAASDVVAAGAAGHGSWSPSPTPMPENNAVAVSDGVAVGAAGHGGSSASPSAAVGASRLPLLSDLGDPYKDLPAFEEVISDEYSEEDDAVVDTEQDSRDAKSRYVLRVLETGQIRYRRRGNLFCPFCGRVNLASDHSSLIQHAVGVGRGSDKRHAAHVRAKHTAYGVFLKKLYAQNIRSGLALPPPPKKDKKDKKGRKGRKGRKSAWRR